LAARGPRPAPVEVCERDEKIGHYRLLTVEEVDEPGGEFACVVHALTVS
jgi:hypothetical protein